MIIESNHSTEIQIGGRRYTYFGGTNYLGLAHHPALLAAAQSTFSHFGLSPGAARSTSGDHSEICALEKDLAAFCKTDSAVVLPAGYLSNSAVYEGLDATVDAWMVRNNAHSSITMTLERSKKPVIVFKIEELSPSFRREHNLEGKRLGIFCEPVDIVTGQLQDLVKIAHFADKSDLIVIDECHSLGVLGDTGRGITEHLSDFKTPAKVLRTGTFSKAFGAYGGLIVGDHAALDAIRGVKLVNGSTPLPAVICAAGKMALKLVHDQPSLIAGLKKNVSYVNSALVGMGYLQFRNNVVPIFSLADSEKMGKTKEALTKNGIFLPSIAAYPTASGIRIGLRWTVQAGHTKEQLNSLIAVLEENNPIAAG